MFAISGLQAAVRELREGPSLTDLLSSGKQSFGRSAHHPTGRQGPALRITRADSVIAPLLSDIERWRGDHGDDRTWALARTVIEPALVLQGVSQNDGEARFILVGSFALDGHSLGCVIPCAQSQQRNRDGQPVAFGQPTFFDLDDEVDAVSAMTEVYRETRDPAGLVFSDRPRLLMLGGERRAIEERVQGVELAGHVPDDSPPRSMAEALERAKQSCPNLVFLPEAEASATDSPFWRPKDVLAATEALDDVARRWRAGELQSVHEALKEAPFAYASDISPTARGKYGGAYRVTYKGDKVRLGPHLKFGRGSPERCARVYWVADEESKTFVVGHFGRHLPDDTS
jgi:hypothetical protein